MKTRLFQFVLVLVTALFITACDDFSILNEVTEEDIDLAVEVIEIDELIETDNFRRGALEHILEGELNRNGDAVGFHYEGLPSAKGSVVEGTRTNPDQDGLYEAEVEVEGKKKRGNRGISSFFPLHWTAQDVVDAINEAYDSKQFISGNTYEGLTDEGIVIHMYLDDNDKIISAFPIL